jgi:hypothetical protein
MSKGKTLQLAVIYRSNDQHPSTVYLTTAGGYRAHEDSLSLSQEQGAALAESVQTSEVLPVAALVDDMTRLCF